ncbi:hypothetical protein LSAT2_027251 [Lamellibrachia satsuma]|nr:hypothetical protein LSAT2_027251 [Lamellibrachia satsuma]
MVAIVFSIVWITYLTYYNARVFGILVTIVVNRFVRNGHVKFGSLSVSVLSGKMLFRDAHWITKDFSMRSQLGFARFRWWRPLTTKKITEDLSHSEPRLIIYLETFEWHIYNISPEYAKMESLFGLEQHIVIGAEELPPVYKSDNSLTKNPEDPAVEDRWIWRDLIPVIKCNVSDGRIIYGNHHLPTSLSVNFSDTNMVYTSKPASTPFDQFMHSLTAEVDNLRVLLVPSPGYEGLVEE